MPIYFSPSLRGFFDSNIHSSMPPDALQITAEQHTALLDAQSQGKRIEPNATGFPVTVDPPGPTADQVLASLTRVVQDHLDAVARGYGYDDIFTAVTYAGEPSVQKFQLEGAALRSWRSIVWATCYMLLAEVQAGQRSVPTAGELVAALPPFVAPEA